MSRRHRAEKRDILPDPKYSDLGLGKFINILMYDGKKSVAESIVYGAFDDLVGKGKSNPLSIFNEAIENVKPELEARSRRIGGSTYQIPVVVREGRDLALAYRWLIAAARARSESTMKEKLCNELLDASSGKGGAVRKKVEIHKVAEANRAFAHYSW